jgi:hypothetical protein
VDFLRSASIGLGDPHRILSEAAAFTVFSLAAFAGAVRVHRVPPRKATQILLLTQVKEPVF